MNSQSTHTDAGASDDATAEKKPSSRRGWIKGVVVGVIAVGLAIPIAFTATPRQCASCHEMKPYYDSMMSSSHRAAVPNCLFCHVKPGVLSLVGYELGFYREIFAHLARVEVKSTGANSPSVASCSRSTCHSLNRETSNSGALKINHRLHVRDEAIACSACHPGAVHAGVAGRLMLPPPRLCKQCHAAKMQECGYCHAGLRTLGAPTNH